jgi:hypothetical protein
MPTTFSYLYYYTEQNRRLQAVAGLEYPHGCDFISLSHFLIWCRYRRCPELLLDLDSLRSCNAHPHATFAARKLLALLVGEPDRYAAGAFSRLDNKSFSACHASIKPLVAYKNLSYGYNPSRGLTRRTPLHLLLRLIFFNSSNTRSKIYDIIFVFTANTHYENKI